MLNYDRPVQRATKWRVYRIDSGIITLDEYEGNFIDCSFYIISKEKEDRFNYVIKFGGFYD